MLFIGTRVVIPTCLRKEILDGLHLAHQGVTAMILWTPKIVFLAWNTVRHPEKCDSCISCMESAPSHSSMLPEYPFQSICIDYNHYAGHRYGVMIDRPDGRFQDPPPHELHLPTPLQPPSRAGRKRCEEAAEGKCQQQWQHREQQDGSGTPNVQKHN